jgi:hypothetical protein
MAHGMYITILTGVKGGFGFPWTFGKASLIGK